jgi:hypothetical protein
MPACVEKLVLLHVVQPYSLVFGQSAVLPRMHVDDICMAVAFLLTQYLYLREVRPLAMTFWMMNAFQHHIRGSVNIVETTSGSLARGGDYVRRASRHELTVWRVMLVKRRPFHMVGSQATYASNPC